MRPRFYHALTGHGSGASARRAARFSAMPMVIGNADHPTMSTDQRRIGRARTEGCRP